MLNIVTRSNCALRDINHLGEVNCCSELYGELSEREIVWENRGAVSSMESFVRARKNVVRNVPYIDLP